MSSSGSFWIASVVVIISLLIISCVIYIKFIQFDEHSNHISKSKFFIPTEYEEMVMAARKSIDDGINRQDYAHQLIYAINPPQPLSSIISNEESNGSIHLTPISAIKDSSRQGILCTTFLSWKQKNVEKLVDNMISLGDFCHWVVIVYNSDSNEFEMNEDMLKRLRNESTRMTKNIQEHLIERNFVTVIKPPPRSTAANEFKSICESFSFNRVKHLISKNGSDASKSINPCSFIEQDEKDKDIINKKIYPKVAMFILLLKYIGQYRYVWLLDGDLSFESFDYKEFYRVHQCSFRMPPLVSQPVLDSAKHTFPFLTKSFWSQKNKNVIATKSGFIEIQAPFMNAAFMEWFLLGFVIPMFRPVHILGADWGFDELFCRAAEMYDSATNPFRPREKRVDSSHINGAGNCGIIIKTPIHHADTKEIQHEVGNVKVALNAILREMIKFHYKQFYWTGSEEKDIFSSPFRSFPYGRITKLVNENCQIDYKQLPGDKENVTETIRI